MSIRTDLNEMLLRDVFEAYTQAEQRMLERLAKRVKRGVTDTGWTEEKFNDVQKLRREVEATLGDVNQLAKAKLSDGIIKAYKAGVASASKDMKKVESILNDFVPEHIQRMILETNNLIDNTSFQILRNTQDAYRSIISETSTQALLGVETRLETAQNALNMFAAKGITGFVDRAGRRWDLASYVEMATRTATARAALQGHIDRQTEIGNDLVMVSSIGTTCPICAQWQGKVLSISGKTPGYSSLDNAKAAGLFHPNCKHTITAYFPEIDDYEPPVTKNNPEKYEATQEQRYNERQIRKWKRVEAAAMTPEAKAKAANMVKKWQGIQREHVAEWDLRRQYGRESIRKVNGMSQVAREEVFTTTIGGNPKEIFKILGDGTEYKKWLRKEIISLDELSLDKKNMSLTEIYKKYIGDTPSKDFKALELKETTYARWLKQQVEDIGVGYKIRVAEPPQPPASIVSSKLTPTEKYKKYIGLTPSKDYKALGITDKSYAKWLKEQADLAEAKASNGLSKIPVSKQGPVQVKVPKKSKPVVKTREKLIKEKIDSMSNKVNFKEALKGANLNSNAIANIESKFNAIDNDNFKKLLSLNQKNLMYKNDSSSFFMPNTKKIHVSFKDEIRNIRGSYVTTFHETGHFLDDAYGYISNDKTLIESLNNDFKKKLTEYEKAWGKIDAKIKINNQLRKDGGLANGVSDTLDGLSLGEVKGSFAHGKDYWMQSGSEQGRYRTVSREFFAHACGALIDKKKYEYMQEWFPSSMKRFEEILKETVEKEAAKLIKQN